MGYDTYVTGGFRIEPKLSQDDIDACAMNDDEGSGPCDSDLVCTSQGDDDTVALVNGQITVIPGKSWSAVKVRWDEPMRNVSDLPGQVDKMARLAKSAGATVTGALYLSGEDHPDLSRIRVENGRALEETPEFLWPNGDKGWG